MKKTLLLALAAFSITAYAQPTITTFYGTQNSTYLLLDSSTPIDQSASGANIVWDFSALDIVGESSIVHSTPTSAETAEFPNSNSKLTISISNDTNPQEPNTILANDTGSMLSLTGFTAAGAFINYDTNNAKVGNYPASYGYNNTDTSAGNYVFQDYSGTFSGTIATNSDAYGTLIIEGQAVPVNRLKVVQNLSINYGFFTGIGTFAQTVYMYYSSDNTEPIFRTTSTSINVPLLSVDQTISTVERYSTTLKTSENNKLSAEISIIPNPVNDILHLELTSAQILKSIIISDVNGKTVFISFENNCNVSELPSGIYFTKITTDQGSVIKKMVRN